MILIKNKKIAEVLKLLQKAFIVNRKVKRDAYSQGDWNPEYNRFDTEVDIELRDQLYQKKSNYIAQAISLIKKNKIPIKYGKNGQIIYFSYLGRQVSFHDPKNIISCKGYNGVWICKIQTKSPFSNIYFSD